MNRERVRANGKKRAGVQGPFLSGYFPLVGKEMRMMPNVTGAAELNWPDPVLICVREKLWYLVCLSIPILMVQGDLWLPSRVCRIYVPSLNFFLLM